jgi:hypothetical protein
MNLEEHPLSFKLHDPRKKLHIFTFEETMKSIETCNYFHLLMMLG